MLSYSCFLSAITENPPYIMLAFVEHNSPFTVGHITSIIYPFICFAVNPQLGETCGSNNDNSVRKFAEINGNLNRFVKRIQ